MRSYFERAHGLLEGFFEGAPDGHGLADGFHRGGEGVVVLGDFSKVKRGIFTTTSSIVGSKLAGVSRVMSFWSLVEAVAHGEFGGDLGNGETGWPLEARAEDRLTRGFISITTMRPFSGFTENGCSSPPVSTPISRITAKEAFAHELILLVGECHGGGRR